MDQSFTQLESQEGKNLKFVLKLLGSFQKPKRLLFGQPDRKKNFLFFDDFPKESSELGKPLGMISAVQIDFY